MLLHHTWPALLLAATTAVAQTTISGTTTSGGTLSGDDVLPTGVIYLSLSSTLTVTSPTSTASLSSSVSNGTSNGTSSATSTTTSLFSTASTSLTLLVGASSTTSNGTASRTTSSTQPTNTQPCNSYPEFCSRSYSNISMVAAHNFPFTQKNNVGRNQNFGVIDQLNDGIRMLQGQVHYVNQTFYFCHTSCDLLNAGKMQDYFAQITKWVAAHPFDVVTILIGNSDYETVFVDKFEQPIIDSGLQKYAYVPPKIPMGLGDWPTLIDMISTQKRVVIFMDYNANQTQIPWILDEFSQLWETPFSPTNAAFPCTAQRPPKLSHDQGLNRMFMANHNLNQQISLLGNTLLVPNTVQINVTNAVSGNGSLGAMVNTCKDDWNRAPNFLLVDFYNDGNVPGSVFEVAATQNNVTYTAKCCGSAARGAASELRPSTAHVFAAIPLLLLANLL